MNLSSALAAFVRYVMRDVRYLKCYPGSVESYDNGTAQVLADDPDIGSVTALVETAVAGTRIEPTRGTRCLIGFKAKDPERAYVAVWDGPLAGTGGAVRLGDGDKQIARVGDFVELNFTPGVPITMNAMVTGTTTLPGPPPVPTPLPPTPAVVTFTLQTAPHASIQLGKRNITA